MRAWTRPPAWPSPLGLLGRRGLRGQGWALAPIALATRPEGAPLTLEGPPGQCAAFRPGELTVRPAIGTSGVMPDGRLARAARHRGRCGGEPWWPMVGTPCAAAAADVGPASEGRGEAAAPQRRDPRQPRPPPRSLPLCSPSIARACSRSLTWAVRRGAPKVRP